MEGAGDTGRGGHVADFDLCGIRDDVPVYAGGGIGSRKIKTGMVSEYVEERDGGYYVAGSRVSLDSTVYAFRGGESPETIQQNFPSLALVQVYGAITFYLEHQSHVDANILEGEEDLLSHVPPLKDRRPEAYARLQRAREQMSTQP